VLLAFMLAAANSASAITTVSAEKPASGLFGALEQRVSVDALASTNRVNEKSALRYDFASDFPVAARGCVYRLHAEITRLVSPQHGAHTTIVR
jgi:hypothetical protein